MVARIDAKALSSDQTASGRRIDVLLASRLVANLASRGTGHLSGATWLTANNVVVTGANLQDLAIDEVADQATYSSAAKEYDEQVKVERDEAKAILLSVAGENVPQVEQLNGQADGKGEEGVKLSLHQRDQVLGQLLHCSVITLCIELAQTSALRVVLDG